MTPRSTVPLIAAAVAALPVLAACSSSGGNGAASGSSVAIKAGDKTCEVGRTQLPAGSTTFKVKNTGSSVTEVYVYGQQDGKYTKVVSEVENIGPGITRDMTVDLTAGTYEFACKPGQKGDGIRTTVTVSGGAGATAQASSSSSADAAAYDREIELSTDGTTISGLSGGAKVGEKIEFALTNKAGGARTFELKDPTGAVAGEDENIAAGTEGKIVATLGRAGTWTLIVEGDGVDDVVAPLTVTAP